MYDCAHTCVYMCSVHVGSVILGGDDFPDHGFSEYEDDNSAEFREGWNFIDKALERFRDDASIGDKSVTILGTIGANETHNDEPFNRQASGAGVCV